MFTHDTIPQRITTLNSLNVELLKLNPSITGLSLSMLETKGSNLAMLDFVIANSPMTMFNGIKRGDILAALKVPLAARVIAAPITFTYDTHGDKHFPGGDAGTKFVLGTTWTKTTLNALLVGFITPHVARIRRDANGVKQTYYLTEPSQGYTGGQELAIQVDYVPSPAEYIGYHGYPRAVTVIGLSRTLGGAAIPL